MTYKEARVYLDKMSKYGSVLGLDTIRGLLRELGNPQDDLKFIHIAGTNGKGSVLAYTSTILSEAGYRVGRYVSPTVVSYLERIQVNSEWISEDGFARQTERVKDAVARMESAGENTPTVFEIETAIAFLYFREMKCDIVVLEAGLGGALDATNIIKNTVCAVFASISRDHIGVIGDTVEEIAGTKAGIIKEGCAVVTAGQKSSVTKVLRQYASDRGCSFVQAEPEKMEVSREDYHGIDFSYKTFRDMHSRMTGRNQIYNLSAVLELISVLRNLGYQITDEDVRNGLNASVWPGRFSCIGENPVFILDGAHNEDAAEKLKASLLSYFPGRTLRFIMGVFRDKEYSRMAEIMGPLAREIYTVDLPDRKRGLPAKKLAEALKPYCSYVRPMPSAGKNQADSVKEAVHMARKQSASDDVVVAFGSLSYLSQVNSAYRSEYGTDE